jgi:lactate dehydrogenase-like 2-hydroxyacid dehydrogenase
VNVPAYSPYAVAEFAVALLMAVNRKIIIASNRIRHGNFALQGTCGAQVMLFCWTPKVVRTSLVCHSPL